VLAGLAVADEVTPPEIAYPAPCCCCYADLATQGLLEAPSQPAFCDARRRQLQVFALVDPAVRVAWSAADGQRVAKGTAFGTLHGSALSILTAERVALNFMQRMSGVATATAAMVAAVQVKSPANGAQASGLWSRPAA
jgi:Quinolinate phosphoribosyl transferase, N-terminal domain